MKYNLRQKNGFALMKLKIHDSTDDCYIELTVISFVNGVVIGIDETLTEDEELDNYEKIERKKNEASKANERKKGRKNPEDNLGDAVDCAPQNTASAIEEPAERILLPKDFPLEAVAEHRVIYSDLDCNGHTNNAKYTVWAMDCLPGDLVRNHDIKEITINFNHEAMFGETVTLYHALKDNAHIVEGRSGDTQIFISKLIFQE